MTRSLGVAAVFAFAIARILCAQTPAPRVSQLGGVWTLNRTMSDLPRDIGFNPAWMAAASKETQGAGSGSSSTGGSGRGRRGSSSGSGDRGGAGPFAGHQESYEDAQRVRLMTAEARTPPARLIIVNGPAGVTMTNELGQSRTLHPNGKEESIEIEGVAFSVTSRRDDNQLVVDYRVDQNREVRYTYSTDVNPGRLIVDVQFLERGAGDKENLVFEPGLPTETTTRSPNAAGQAAAPAPGQPAHETFDQRPGAELRGLTTVGLLVEELSAQATACGLSQDAIESALSKRLTTSGLTVRRNSDEDTYVYVNVQTTMLTGGMCVSRYDAFLYTHATANLTYAKQPVLVQVSLMHRGGVNVGAPAGHGSAIVRGLEGYIDVFTSQIRDANK
jgi:hypothetical protein